MVNLFTVAKLMPIAVLCLAGVFFVSWQNLSGTPLPSTDTWGRAVLLWVFAFGGFEATMIPAGEVRDPMRDGPRALLTALLIVTVTYALVQLVVAGTLSAAAFLERQGLNIFSLDVHVLGFRSFQDVLGVRDQFG